MIYCTQLCPTLCGPMASSLPGFSVHGISQQVYWRGLPPPVPGHHPDPGIEPASFASPALAGGFFTTSATWEALYNLLYNVKTKTLHSVYLEN